jgi:hypothetical protein
MALDVREARNAFHQNTVRPASPLASFYESAEYLLLRSCRPPLKTTAGNALDRKAPVAPLVPQQKRKRVVALFAESRQ